MELGVPNAQIILAAQQTLYMVFVSLAIGTALYRLANAIDPAAPVPSRQH